MDDFFRALLADVFRSPEPFHLRVAPLLEIQSALSKQAMYLGFNLSFRSWSRGEDRLIFKKGPSLFLADLNSQANKPGLLVLEGFWRSPNYEKAIVQIQNCLETKDRLIIIDDAFFEGSVLNYSSRLLIGATYSSLVKIKPADSDAWIKAIQSPPVEDLSYNTLDSLVENGSSRISVADLQKLRITDFLFRYIPFHCKMDDLVSLEILIEQLRLLVGNTTQFESLREQTDCSADTIKRWLRILETSGLCFSVQPWFHNIDRALKSDRKYYFVDWIDGSNGPSRTENLVFSHVYQACKRWNQSGASSYQLRHIKSKDGASFDLLILKDQTPWLLVDVYQKDRGSARTREAIHGKLECPYIFITDEPYAWTENAMGKTISLPHFLTCL